MAPPGREEPALIPPLPPNLCLPAPLLQEAFPRSPLQRAGGDFGDHLTPSLSPFHRWGNHSPDRRRPPPLPTQQASWLPAQGVGPTLLPRPHSTQTCWPYLSTEGSCHSRPWALKQETWVPVGPTHGLSCTQYGVEVTPSGWERQGVSVICHLCADSSGSFPNISS